MMPRLVPLRHQRLVPLLVQSFQSLTTTLRQAADMAFPVHCPLCGTTDPALFSVVLSGPDTGKRRPGGNTVFCQPCTEAIAPAIESECTRCGAEIGPYSRSDNGCVHCRRKQLRFDSVVCLGMYRGRLKQAMLSAKWSFSATNMNSLAELLLDRQFDRLKSLQIDCIIPMPQHWQQRLTRHFNPAWLIAETLGRGLQADCDVHILRRSRRTRPQKRVSVSQRFANQRDSFRLRDSHLVAGRRFLIVDDVLTTGATCSEVARLLKSQGATACHACVVGRVLDHSA